MEIAALLLCGGAARRFGADKLLAGREPIAARAARNLIAATGRALAVIPLGRTQLRKVLEAAGCDVLETDRTDFGRRALFYDGIPIVVDENQPDDEVRGASGAVTSSIYPIKFGQAEGVMGLEHGGIDIEEIGELETKDATRWRIKWYAGLAIFSELGVARLRGITAA